ncbi:putative nucleotidyltransferase [Desulfuromonas soudanensis]|uniref:Putative nucleotidyltransferase n=1 Tax=Desulfuromonas soudanensis TaxID=1603606 RepID=A0A0M4D4H9_9BACT|nr:nucleotidyltransferase family protein [Desulfuromonas soudanensis]ALC15497.1 putative nucleotidyltransferase [Desulfuromonas soudanensis]
MDPFIETHRQAILELAAQRGAHRIQLFGSMAKNKGGPTSDVDFLVEMEPGKSAFALGGLLMDLQDLLGRRVDVVTPAALHPRIREQVLREAVDL